jgi:hypothetical protein
MQKDIVDFVIMSACIIGFMALGSVLAALFVSIFINTLRLMGVL